MKNILVLAIALSANSVFPPAAPTDLGGHSYTHHNTCRCNGKANQKHAMAPHTFMKPDAAPKNPSDVWPNYMILG